MGRPPACHCDCGSVYYNIRKIRISDGRTIWHSHVVNPPGSVYDPGNPYNGRRALENAVLADCDCCRGGRLVLNLAGSPFCLSSTTGQTVWADNSRLLNDGRNLFRVIDSDDSGNWIGAFTNEPLGMIDGDNVRQWSFSGSFAPTRVKLGDGTFVAYKGPHGIAYGNASDGSLIYDNGASVNAPSSTTSISDIVDEKAQAVFEQPTGSPGNRVLDLPTFIPEGGYPSLPPYAYTDGNPTNDAKSQVVSGRQAYFYATQYEGAATDYRTGQPLTGTAGILKVDFASPSSYRFSMLDLISVPWRIHKCPDGIIAIFKDVSFYNDGKRFEIVKCDFDLNVLWMKRWTPNSTYPGLGGSGFNTNPFQYGLWGISGDAAHVYISGDQGVWSPGHV